MAAGLLCLHGGQETPLPARKLHCRPGHFTAGQEIALPARKLPSRRAQWAQEEIKKIVGVLNISFLHACVPDHGHSACHATVGHGGFLQWLLTGMGAFE